MKIVQHSSYSFGMKMMGMRCIPALILCLTITFAYGKDYIFESITTHQGLSQNDVLDIYQGSDAYMWFATHEGINRYDGLTFRTFRIAPKDTVSISSNLISALTEDQDGNLWIATQDNGICKYHPGSETFTNFYNTKQHPNLLSSNVTFDLFCAPDGRIFVTTYSGIDCFEKNASGSYRVRKIPPPPTPPGRDNEYAYRSFYQDKDGNLLAIHRTGFNQVHSTRDSVWLTPFLDQMPPLTDIRVIRDAGTAYLIGSVEGIIRVKKSAPQSLEIYPCGLIRALEVTQDSLIWAGGQNGLFLFGYFPKRKSCFVLAEHFIQGQESSNLCGSMVLSLATDHTGVLWIGTNGGINRYNPKSGQFRSYNASSLPGSLSTNKVFSIFEDSQQNLWIGTDGGGLNFLPAKKAKQYQYGFESYYTTLPNEQNVVFNIIEVKTQNSEIWAGTGYKSRMICLKPTVSKNNWDLIPSYIPIPRGMIITLLQDEFGSIWLGSYNGGLYRAIRTQNGYRVDDFNITNSNLGSNTIRSLMEDSQGRLWIGSSDGLMMLNQDEKQSLLPDFFHFNYNPISDSSLSNNYILPIIETHEHTIWIGTMGGGIFQYHEGSSWNNGYFVNLTTDEGLANNTVKAIVEDDQGFLWISTNHGLSRLEPVRKEFHNYYPGDGLQGYEFSEMAGCKLRDGEILFGGSNGFTAFYPDRISADTIPPTIVLNSLYLHDNPVGIMDTIRGRIVLKQSLNTTHQLVLPHTENEFTIHFAALHYAKPLSNQYQYQLVGYDKNWIKAQTGVTFAKYTNLDPGKYIFKVMASNCDGYWNYKPRTLEITILPPFWQTLWFRVLATLITVSLIMVVYNLKIHRVEKQKQQLEKMVYERTNELIEMNSQLEESKEELVAQKEELQNKHQELLAHKANLEDKVQERTLELQHAKERAEESDQLKSAFLANMSHEIRTPMNAVVGFSSLLAEEEMPHDKRQRFLNLIKQNSEKLLVLIDDILAISLIEANQLHVNLAPFSLNTLLEDCFHTARINAKNEKVKLRLNNALNEENIQIVSDLFRINQIVTNLLSNAMKFTHQGEIVLGTRIDAANPREVLLSVRDTGNGIPEKDRNRIFERFRKIDNDPTILYPGVGLGLSISHKLAEILGCQLSVQSEVGKGSEFILRIPLTLPQKDTGETEGAPKQRTDPRFLRNLSLLIVEDESANAELLERILGGTGCQLTRANNGLEAVKLFVKGKIFDIVLMDIKMPVMNGMDALTEIRKMAPHQCIIAQTAFALDSDRKKLTDHGFNHYIKKPIRKEELFSALHTCCQKNK